ncbi:hypothetical protein FQN54_003830 [Arachnomyces sp. PD_36]|nr:hypothetical protein FQN54_003830 [Arachnomyces sp. PD_36]
MSSTESVARAVEAASLPVVNKTGLDYVAGGQLAALPKFKEEFGILQPHGSYIVPARYLSAWASIGPACDIIAALIAVPFLEKYGRKPQILVASILSIVGILLQQLATEWKMHLAGRAVNGHIVLGQFAIVIISYASSSIDGKWQWWTPVVSMYIFPLLLMLVHAEARKSLQRMYGILSDQFYDTEMKRLEAEGLPTKTVYHHGDEPTIRFFALLRPSVAEIECFRGSNLKRTVTAILAASGQQLIGATFVAGYATYFFQLINIENFFLASSILYVVMIMSSSSEVANVRLRGVTQALVTITNAFWGLIMQFTIPYMINNDAGAFDLGGKTGFIFFGTGMVTAVAGYFLFPETKGISFEVIDKLYEKRVSPRYFKQRARDLHSGNGGLHVRTNVTPLTRCGIKDEG